MLKLKTLPHPGLYQTGTGETGINDVKGRIMVGKYKYDPLYGLKLDSAPGDFVRTVIKEIGCLKVTPPDVTLTNTLGGKKLGYAFFQSNTIILWRHTLGILVHELSHIVANKMVGDRGHKEGFKAFYRLVHAGTYKVLGLDAHNLECEMLHLLSTHKLVTLE